MITSDWLKIVTVAITAKNLEKKPDINFQNTFSQLLGPMTATIMGYTMIISYPGWSHWVSQQSIQCHIVELFSQPQTVFVKSKKKHNLPIKS